MDNRSEITDREWESFGYKTEGKCDVCGDACEVRIEPRFGYKVCRKHVKTPPNQIKPNG